MKQENDNKEAKLLKGPVGKTLARLTIPMVFGLMSMMTFNLVDTFYVGRLGVKELAALSFTFPVVLVINSIALGLGMGASAVISRAIGEGNFKKVKRLTTDSLSLAVLIVSIFVVIGFLTIEPVFHLIGAEKDMIVLISQYMEIWYLGMVFVVIPMVGNNAIRATGDTKTPATIMLVSVLVNLILDPLLIFGIGPFPRLELRGAAIATVIARASSFLFALYILNFRYRMLTFVIPKMRSVLNSWRRVLYIGIPNILIKIMVPLGIGVITRIVSIYGSKAVAGYGVASRIEFFVLTVINALSSVLAPFVGQNWGGEIMGRVKQGIKSSAKFSMIWGLFLFIVLALFSRQIGSLFNKNPDVISNVMLYLCIVPIAYGLRGIFVLSTASLNVLNRPLHSAGLTFIQMFILIIPLAYAGSFLFNLKGVFIGLSLSYCIAGALSYYVLLKIVKVEYKKIV